MPNLIYCVGYALGKIHTGLLSYVCQLLNEGVREPAETIFGALGLANLPNRVKVQREWRGIDLVISEESSGDPICMVEIKVDDYEHEVRNTDRWQTEIYPTLFPSCKNRYFITLGAGEYYHEPRSKEFVWIRVRDFYRCLCDLKTQDPLLRAWVDAIGNEIKLQGLCYDWES